jgi:dinuclear metal center YbgI/SA1388 family protein
MTSVGEVAGWLDQFAPSRLAEAWDNVGLLWGDPSAQVTRVMACLSVTPTTAAEAVAAQAELVVSHHPVLFRPAKVVRADNPEGGVLWKLARVGVAILSAHTALDNTDGGINDGLARRLELVDIGPLRHSPSQPEFKVVAFVPRADRENVMAAAFAAGGGRIGDYEQCSYSSSGLGTFFGTEAANPAVGQAGRLESVREWRLEVICPVDRLSAVVAAVRSSHSYEEPAIDVYQLHRSPSGPGVGRLGRLPTPESLRDFAVRVSHLLSAPALKFAGEPERKVERVAIACGAGDEFVSDAASAGADVLLTGEARFQRALEAEALGLGLVIAGHHETERPGVEDLAARLALAFPSLTVWCSRCDADPWKSPASVQ